MSSEIASSLLNREIDRWPGLAELSTIKLRCTSSRFPCFHGILDGLLVSGETVSVLTLGFHGTRRFEGIVRMDIMKYDRQTRGNESLIWRTCRHTGIFVFVTLAAFPSV